MAASSKSNDFHHRRLVIFAGPHKSASSSVQELFMNTASSQHPGNMRHHPSLQNWTWPFNPRRHSYLPRKGFAPLVTEGPGYVQLIHDTILDVWEHNDTNLILGTEELDRFGTAPWSHRNGIEAIQGVYNITQPREFQVVVNYRRPRRDQWISIWKQLTRSEPKPYSEFICNENVEEQLRIWEYLDCVANPLGLVQALLQQQWAVRLLDMEGIAHQKWDVGHVLACHVLQVPCEDHWLPGMHRPMFVNTKTGNPELSQHQLNDLEWALRQRDCGYRTYLESHTSTTTTMNHLLQVYEGETLWEGCDHDSTDALVFTNTTFLLDLLQSQMGCGSGDKDAIRKSRERPPKPPKVAGKQSVAGTRNSPPSVQESATVDPMVQTVKAQLYVLFLLTIVVVTLFVRQLKCKGHASRRLAGKYLMNRGRE
jgi:hypothetical protein